MKKFLIATVSVAAISGVLGTSWAWSQSSAAEEQELKALELRMNAIKEKMIRDKTRALEAQKHENASEAAATSVSDSLAPLMKALGAFNTADDKPPEITVPGLSGALPDNPLLKAVVNAGIKYFSQGAALTQKATNTGNLATSLGPLLGSVNDDTKLMMCQAIAPLLGISGKLCPTFMQAKKLMG